MWSIAGRGFERPAGWLVLVYYGLLLIQFRVYINTLLSLWFCNYVWSLLLFPALQITQ